MLHIIDWIIIGLFIVGNVVLGVLMRGRQSKSADFFIARASLQGLLGNTIIGLSLTATFFSGISFLMYPSLVISHGLVVYACILNSIVYYFIVTRFFIPRFCKRKWETPYEILDVHFGKTTRKITGLLYVLMRLGWMSALIYAPTVAILGATGTDERYFWPVVLAIGLGSTFYASLGGLRGIMVTDALQMLVIIGGVGITICYVLIYLPVSFNDAWSMLSESGRLDIFDFSVEASSEISTWSVLFGTFFSLMGLYFGDQMALQRYMSADSLSSVKQSFIINIIGVIVILVLLACVGLSVAAWYAFNPQSISPKDEDQIFPFFIASELPVGVAGLVMAALLAATMSSMSSGVNALSSAVQTDLVPEFFARLDDRNRLMAARSLSFLAGIIATLGAGLVAQLGQIFDIAQKLLGLFLGPIGVCFIIAVLNIRVRERYMIAGLISGIVAGVLVALSPDIPFMPTIHALWTSPASMFFALIPVLVGWSFDRPADARQ